MPFQSEQIHKQRTEQGVVNDRDSLFILPLSDLPIRTETLRRGVLTKNTQMDSVFEVFRDQTMGSGQISLNNLYQLFSRPSRQMVRDIKILKKVGELKSFDVYALRIGLRKLGVDVESPSALKLSEEKRKQLDLTMKHFVRPMLKRLFGLDLTEYTSFVSIYDNLTPEERRVALENMRQIARMMNMNVKDLPEFIEDCGDLYLSIAYYHDMLMSLLPQVKEFKEWMDYVEHSSQYRTHPPTRLMVDRTQSNLKVTLRSVRLHLQRFSKAFDNFWDDVTQENYEELKSNIMSQYEGLGGTLCSLTVKIERFNEVFPGHKGSYKERIDFIRQEISVELQRIAQSEIHIRAIAS